MRGCSHVIDVNPQWALRNHHLVTGYYLRGFSPAAETVRSIAYRYTQRKGEYYGVPYSRFTCHFFSTVRLFRGSQVVYGRPNRALSIA